ncbi:MAG: ATP-binding cassette domain-containing protein [Treponemataceae bacterium]|nr:ATP-binding cassette domain-containing protein [Spirochaetales bacterium]MDY6030845.1 ATP-binding cassette domain-containing protein [Treponemataceae bacterium]
MLRLENIEWATPTGEQILQGINITFPDNKLVVITGPNGGGKTTTAKIIAGIVQPQKGKIFLDDEDITNLDITERAKRGISFAFQQPVRFKGITVRDILKMASPTPLKESEISELLHKVGLCAKDYLDREINAALSGGEIKRIEIATVLARKTRISVFDEPEAGIDLWSFNNLIDVFSKLRNEKNGSLIVISHQERILSIADIIVVVGDGKVKKAGPAVMMLPEIMANAPQTKSDCPKGREVTYNG